jgi:hypothetical protein
VNEKNLSNYEKSENDLKKGIEGREPSEKYRLEKEDLLALDWAAADIPIVNKLMLL